jgi:nucleotide-binding universal stress UspA family protein
VRRVLVPIDGSSLAASILPDARQLAGRNGEIILISDPISRESIGRTSYGVAPDAVEEVLADLESQAEPLRREGMKVETHALLMVDAAFAIDAAIRLYRADMVACATHGRGPLGRLFRGGIVWRALASSTVPVLVRHLGAPDLFRSILGPERRILVPLDGSERAEQALPLAKELATEWDSSIWLVHVVSTYPITGFPRTTTDPGALTDEQARRAAQDYLDRVAASLPGKVHKHVLFGSVSEHLIASVRTWNIGHVVMTSHGRTGMPRVLLGSVADDLIQHLTCPIIVIPAHAIHDVERSDSDRALQVLEPA